MMANFPQLAIEFTKFPNPKLLEIEPLNSRQCKNLLDNLQNCVQAIQKIHNNLQGDAFDQAEKDMLCILKKARCVVEECCKKNLFQVVMMQINNKELFRELLWEFECSFNVMCDVFHHFLPSREDEIKLLQSSTTFYPTSLDDVEEDQNSICERLLSHLKRCTVPRCKDCTLAQYLLGRVRGLQKAEGGEIDSLIFPHKYPCPIYENPPTPLGIGGFGSVYPTRWLGFDTVTKVILVKDHDHEKTIWKEASIMGGLNHPNIINFFCCGVKTKCDKSGIEQKTFELVMEQGKTDLSQFLKQQNFLSERDAIELMLQIARGICYLHDMKVAHRDLKPCNIVVTKKLECVNLKLVDFGISKIEVKELPNIPTNGNVHGSSGYMAPEAFQGRNLKLDAFKTDVFSFGMMCSQILTTKKHFDNLLVKDYVNSILKGERPKLPKNCSSELKSLIHKCWSLDPLERPTFLNICQILTKLKREGFVKAYSNVGAPKLVKDFTSYIDPTTNQENWTTILRIWKFLGSLWFISILWEMFFGFNQQLSRIIPKLWEPNSITSSTSNQEVSNTTISNPTLCEANQNANGHFRFIGLNEKILAMEKRLQCESSLALIGMGGIGKSALAKALSAHISHQFDVTCFVGDFADGKCSFSLEYKSCRLRGHPQITTFREGQENLEQSIKAQKVLIVLDNVGNSSQLDKLLGPCIFEGVNGSRLIASSRKWKSLERHVPISSRINMQTLDEEQSRELFSKHAFVTNEPCLPYLQHVIGKIVSICNGLPLSLEVMGTNLHGEKRLRVWERTMHRLLRARHDRTTDEKIWSTLRVSFDELNNNEKEMFLDIACFFCKDLWRDGIAFTKESLYRKYDSSINILQQTLESLQDKSLLKVDEDGILNMHDHLRDMGRMIVDMEYNGTRIWNLCLTTFIEHQNQKDMALVEGLSFTRFEKNNKKAPSIHLKAMKNLQLLDVKNCENVDLLFAIMRQTTRLKWLHVSFPSHCDDFSFQQYFFMQKNWDFAHDNLCHMHVFEICNHRLYRSISLETLKVIPLKQLTFYDCHTSEEFPNGLTKIQGLEELSIIDCKNFKTIPQGLSNLTCLIKLQLNGCLDLEEFPSGVRTLIALKELDFHGCKSLKSIPEGFEGLTCLKTLYMWDCEELKEFPHGVHTLVALEELDFHGCKSLELILEGFEGLTCLKKLYLWDCIALKKFPCGVGTLVGLEELYFNGCKSLELIYDDLEGLSCLKILTIWDCESLKKFPCGVHKLVALEELDFHGCKSLKIIPEGFEGLTCLKKLYMWDCINLEIFPRGVHTLMALEEVDFQGCKSLKLIPDGFGGLTCLKKLYMCDCIALKDFPYGMRSLVALEELDFHGCKSLEIIHEGFEGLTCLKKLYMYDCIALEKFPHGIHTLIALEELDFHGCKSLKLTPGGFDRLTSLEKLYMCDCEALQEFPCGACNLVALEELDFHGCKSLKRIPEGFEGLKCLKKLYMWDCIALEEFPCGIPSLTTLEELYFNGCKSLKRIPEGFEGLTCLKRLAIWDCEALEKFPCGVHTLVALEELDFHGCKSLNVISEGFQGLTCLTKLYMWDCVALNEFPCGVSTLVALEELYFNGCKSLKRIPENFESLTCLKKLHMCDCEALEEFPCGVQSLVALEELYFSGCKSLNEIPEGFGGLTCLKKLVMWDCIALKEFPCRVHMLGALQELDFHGCKSLKQIQDGFHGLTCLTKLYMWDCESLEEFPCGVTTLVALEKLDIHGCKSLKIIPEGFKGLTCLKKLYMWDCGALKEFPCGVDSLMALEELYVHECKSLELIPEGLKGLTCLKTLTVWDCLDLKIFPHGVHTLVALQELDFHGCESLEVICEGFEVLTCLKKLYMYDCIALEKFPCGVCMLVALEELFLNGCMSLKSIPKGFEALTSLRKLHMCDCKALNEFPCGVCNLVALEELDFHGCKSLKRIPEGFEGLKCLKKLYMWDCIALEEFPCGIPSLTALEELYFNGCKSLKRIPEGFEGLTCLKRLAIWDCEALEKFPCGVHTLVALEELDFHGCKSLNVISEGFQGLTCLTKLYMWDCVALEEFPCGVSTLVALEELDFHGCKSLKVIPEGLTCFDKTLHVGL